MLQTAKFFIIMESVINEKSPKVASYYGSGNQTHDHLFSLTEAVNHLTHHNDEGYWREVKAIIGGVLGFWGGVGSLGTLFLVSAPVIRTLVGTVVRF